MNIQITKHRKMLATLGVGALALAAVACGSADPVTLVIEGEPVYSLGAPAPGFAHEDVVEMIVLDTADERHLDDEDERDHAIIVPPFLVSPQ